MKIKKIILKNIRSYEDQEISFPDGSLLLSGDVGSGKTTILLAVEYALFGLQPGQKGSALLRNNAQIGEVSLELEVSGREILIERKMKRSGKSVTNEYASITVDGKKTESSITEIKTKILNILGYPPEFIKKNNILYRYTVYTPQENMKQIILEDSEVRLNVLRHVFGIDKYKRIRENLTILTNNLKEEIRFLQSSIQTLDNDKQDLIKFMEQKETINLKISQKNSEFEINVRRRKEIEKESLELEEKLKEKLKFESEIEKALIMLASKKETLSSLSKQQADLSKEIDNSNEEFKSEWIGENLNKINSTKKEIEELNASYFTSLNQIDSLLKENQELSEKKNRVFNIRLCPTCLQDVSTTHKHNIVNATEARMAEIKKLLEKLNMDKADSKAKLVIESNKLKSLEGEKEKILFLQSKKEFISRSIKHLDDIKKNRELLEKDIVLLNKHIDGLKDQTLQFSKFDIQSKSKKDELKQAFILEKNSEISLAELRKEFELYLRDITRMKDAISLKEESKIKLSSLIELSDWLSNYFLSLIDFTERNVLIRLRKEFSKLFNSWFNALAGESFEVQLDENFTPLILQGGIEMEYSFLSGGERTAVALAYRLALNQTINSIMSTIKTKDLIILDEPTEGFSETQIDKMRDIFEELDVEQLIIVSHEQKIESFVDSVIKIKKEGDVSSLNLPLEGL